jgi:hypothetical protein
MKYGLLLLSILFVGKIAMAQNFIEPFKATAVKTYLSFGELPMQKKLAALEDRDVFIYLSNDNKIWLAELIGSQWNAFVISEKFTSEKEYKIEQYDFDGLGKKELVLYWDFIGKQDFLNIMLKGVQIWNTNEQLCYLDEYTVCFEERYVKATDSHYYGGCERNINLQGNMLEITPFECDLELGFEILPEKIYSGKFTFNNDKFIAL